MNLDNEIIHKKEVPLLHALLWAIALFLGYTCSNIWPEKIIMELMAVFIVFVVFLWETAIIFLDIKSRYPKKNFVGNIFGLNARLFFIIPIPFVLGAIYKKLDLIICFYLALFSMVWLKWEIASFANNIESYLVDIKPEIYPNNFNQ